MRRTTRISLLAVCLALAACAAPARAAQEEPHIAVMLGHYPQAAFVPHPEQTSRVLTCARLFQRGLVDTIVVSGGYTFGPLSEARMARIGLVALGVPDSAIVEEDRSATTIENEYFTEMIFEDRGWDKNVALVSQGEHLMRAEPLFASRGFAVRKVTAPHNPGRVDDYPPAPAPLPAWDAPPEAIVLYEPYHGDDPVEAPDAGMVRRVQAAAAAFRAGAAPRVVVFADWYTRGPVDPAETLTVALVALGVDPAAIITVGRLHYANRPWLDQEYAGRSVLFIAPPGQAPAPGWVPWLLE